MANFPHLKLPFKVDGSYLSKSSGGPKKKYELTAENKKNRSQHGGALKKSIDYLLSNWKKIREQKKAAGLSLPNENDIPIFLKIDDIAFLDIDSFQNWGIEIISEEREGFIIGASIDGLQLFQKNLDEFLKAKGTYKDKAAQIWEIIIDDSQRIKEILEGDLKDIWETIDEKADYIVELGVSCYVPNRIAKYPTPNNFDSEEKYNAKLAEFEENEKKISIQRDEKQLKRENEIEHYIKNYNGELVDVWDNEVDAVFFKIKITGKGLKDIVQTYQYLYRVSLPPIFDVPSGEMDFTDLEEATIVAPETNSPSVCIIDSGIQEDHRLLSPAINPLESVSFVLNDATTADYVKQSGHGTKVAGAVLYPRNIPVSGTIQLETKIQNARILDNSNKISDSEFGPALMENIVYEYFGETKIFNLSVSEKTSYTGTHMPELAGAIDKIMHEKDILFIISAGNLQTETGDKKKKGIKEHLENGDSYPDYLLKNECGISNPGVSAFALTVGSIGHTNYEDADYYSLAGEDKISPFSRTGLGMWNTIKPEVVEYGGDLLKNKLTFDIVTHEVTSIELVNSTLHGSPAHSKSDVGTSFSTPKVSYIAAKLQKEFPDETAQMYRALIVHSARLPGHCFDSPTLDDIKYYGYGIPDVDRATNNSKSRITFINKGHISGKKADIYQIKIPQELRGEGKEFKLLVEVTMAFTAKTRLTRKGAHSYLSTWLEWKSSNYNETFESFRNKTLEYLEIDEIDIEEGLYSDGDDPINWTIRENPVWGTVKGISRNNNTVQKDWTIIEPYQFAEDFNIAIIGHAGWDKSLKNEIPYALCVSFEVIGADIDIYNMISIEQEIEEEQGS